MQGVLKVSREVRNSYRLAKRVVETLPEEIEGQPLRCHEVARVVSHFIPGRVVDGRCGPYDHSWLILGDFILDPYAIGSYPLVQLADPYCLIKRHYVEGAPRDDVRHEQLHTLVHLAEEGMLAPIPQPDPSPILKP